MSSPIPRTGHRHRREVLAVLAAAAAAVLIAVLAAAARPAAAQGTLTQVTNFGSNPGNLNMYSYLPTGLVSDAPLVVALHGCTQSATDYYDNSGWPKIADEFGVALVFAEQPSMTNPILNCFDWGTPSDDSRGQGEAESIYQMIQYAESNYGVNPKQIYITGLSAGAGMTADMLADYPDVFAGGSIDSGPAAQCSTSGIYDTNCTSGTTNNSAAQWGSLIKNSDPGYSGPYPRVAVWQGSADTTVNPAELTYNMDGWTNVWGLSQTPTSTQSLPGGTTEKIYATSGGTQAVATFEVSGMTHGLAVNPGSANDQCGTTGTYYLNYICSSYYTAVFWGLTNGSGSPSPSPSPTTTATPTPTPTPTSLGCWTTDNYDQVAAGRAYQSLGYVYADGSNEDMGLYNTYQVTSLEETSPGYYVIVASC
jgi:poly(hydroxyalkanoate) depolymerase family esterase